MTEFSARIAGILYIVATPIGNLEDISLRAIKILKSVDLILAEDTRHTAQLLSALGIKKKLISFHAHNEADKCKEIIDAIALGQNYALVSDAGTPLISDPGLPLVRLAQARHIEVIAIPGASALIAALSISGISCDAFSFAGFLPAKLAARRERLQSFASIQHTLVFYESTHRLEDALLDIAFVYGADCQMVLAKELTKIHEQVIRGSPEEILLWLKGDPHRSKGEFVLIIAPRIKAPDHQKEQALLRLLLAELPLKRAVALVAQISDCKKNQVYAWALELSQSPPLA